MIGLEELAVFGISAEVIAKALGDLYLEALKDKTKKLFDWLKDEDKARSEIRSAAKRYVQSYTERHGQVKVLGMSEPLPLAGIYTAVQFLDQSEIRRYADAQGLEEMFRAQGRRQLQSGGKTVDGVKLANEKAFLMVLGQPGAGKSTFLRRIGLEALKGKEGKYEHALFPVLLELRRYPAGKLDLEQAIAKELGNCGFREPEESTKRLLEKGRLLVLLDGLDEIPSQHQSAVIDHIQDFVDQHHTNRFIASCRTAAYQSRFRRFTDVLMADFDNEQIKQFINNWFSSARHCEADTAARCWDTLNEPDNAAAKELAQNPLLLTLLCITFEADQCFPRNRAVLYGEALDVLLKRWAAQNCIYRDPIYKDLTLPLEKIMLGQLAHDFFQANRLFFSQAEVSAFITQFLADNLNAPKHLDGDEVLKAIEIQQGILVARDHSGGVLSFSHLTFQEYFTAQHLADHCTWDNLARKNLGDDRWREVFLLTAGLARPNCDSLLRAMARECRAVAMASPTLVELLRWANSITHGSQSSAHPAAKRVAAIAIASTLVRTLGSVRFQLIFLAFALARVLGLNLALSHPNRLHTLVVELNNQYILNRPLTIPALPERKLQDPAFKAELQTAVTSITRELGLTETLLRACIEDRRVINKYLRNHDLLLDCKIAAISVSPAAWAEIEAGLFLVDDPEPPPPAS
ncbi:NACHT domain-containing protein [Methylomagnum sp.]